MQNKHAWSMAAEGIQLYYRLLELVGPYDILNIHAWIMVAEDVVLYCIHNWSMLVHTIYKIYVLITCPLRVLVYIMDMIGVFWPLRGITCTYMLRVC